MQKSNLRTADRAKRQPRGKPADYPPFNSKAGKALRRELEQSKRRAADLIDSAEREENAARLLRRD
jgi:hypothetical protein